MSQPTLSLYKLPHDLDSDQLLHHLNAIITAMLSSSNATSSQSNITANPSTPPQVARNILQISPKSLAILTLLFKQWVMFRDDEQTEQFAPPPPTTKNAPKKPAQLTPQQQQQQLLTKVMKNLPVLENIIIQYIPNPQLLTLPNQSDQISPFSSHHPSTSHLSNASPTKSPPLSLGPGLSNTPLPLYEFYPYTLQPFPNLSTLSIEPPPLPHSHQQDSPDELQQSLIFLSLFTPNLTTANLNLFTSFHKPLPQIPIQPIAHFDLLLPRLQALSLSNIRIPKFNDSLWFILLQHFTPYSDRQLAQAINPAVLYHDETDARDDELDMLDEERSVSQDRSPFSTPKKSPRNQPSSTPHMTMSSRSINHHSTPKHLQITPNTNSTTPQTARTPTTPASRRSDYQSESTVGGLSTEGDMIEEVITLNGHLLWQLILEFSTSYYKHFWTHLMKTRQLLNSLKFEKTTSTSTSLSLSTLPLQTNHTHHNRLTTPSLTVHHSFAQRAYSPILLSPTAPFTLSPLNHLQTRTNPPTSPHRNLYPTLTPLPNYYLSRHLPSTLADCATQVHHTHFSWRNLHTLSLSRSKCFRIGPALFLTPSLSNLTLSQTSLHDPRGLCTLSSLTSLNLSFNPASIHISPTHHCLSPSHINHVDFQPDFAFGKVDLISTLIHECSNLHVLNLAGNNITDTHIPALSLLRHLPLLSLDLSYNLFQSVAQLWPLRSLTWLRAISLHNSPLARAKNYRTNVAIIFVDNWAVPDAFSLYSAQFYAQQEKRITEKNKQEQTLLEKPLSTRQNPHSPHSPTSQPHPTQSDVNSQHILQFTQGNLFSPFPSCPHFATTPLSSSYTPSLHQLLVSSHSQFDQSPPPFVQPPSSSLIAQPFYIDGVPLSEQEAMAALRSARALHEQLKNLPLFSISQSPTYPTPQPQSTRSNLNATFLNQQTQQNQTSFDSGDEVLFDPAFNAQNASNPHGAQDFNKTQPLSRSQQQQQQQQPSQSQQINIASALMQSILPPHLSWSLIQQVARQEKVYLQQNVTTMGFGNNPDFLSISNSNSLPAENVNSVLLQLHPPIPHTPHSTHPHSDLAHNDDEQDNSHDKQNRNFHPPLSLYHRFSHLFLSQTVAATTNGCLLSVLASPCIISQSQLSIIQNALYVNDTIDYSSSNSLLSIIKYPSLQDTIDAMVNSTNTTTPAKRKKRPKNIDGDDLSITGTVISTLSSSTTKTSLKDGSEKSNPNRFKTPSKSGKATDHHFHQRADDFLYDDDDIVVQADGHMNTEVSNKLRELAQNVDLVSNGNALGIGDLAQVLDQGTANDDDFLIVSSTIHKNKKGKKQKKVAPDGQWSEKKVKRKAKVAVEADGTFDDSMTFRSGEGSLDNLPSTTQSTKSGEDRINSSENLHHQHHALDALSPLHKSDICISYDLDLDLEGQLGPDGSINLDDLDEADLRLRTSTSLINQDDLAALQQFTRNGEDGGNVDHSAAIDQSLHNKHAMDTFTFHIDMDPAQHDTDHRSSHFHSRRPSQALSQSSQTSQLSAHRRDRQDKPNKQDHSHTQHEDPLNTTQLSHTAVPMWTPTSDPKAYRHMMFRSFLRYFDMDIGLLAGIILESTSKRPKKRTLISSIFKAINSPPPTATDDDGSDAPDIAQPTSLNSEKHSNLVSYQLFTNQTRFLASLAGLSPTIISMLYPTVPYDRHRFQVKLMDYQNERTFGQFDAQVDQPGDEKHSFVKSPKKLNIFIEKDDAESVFLSQLISSSVAVQNKLLQSLQPLIWPTMMSKQRVTGLNSSIASQNLTQSDYNRTTAATNTETAPDRCAFDDVRMTYVRKEHNQLSNLSKPPSDFVDRLLDIDISSKICTAYEKRAAAAAAAQLKSKTNQPGSSSLSLALTQQKPSQTSTVSDPAIKTKDGEIDLSDLIFDQLMGAQNQTVQDDFQNTSLIALMEAESVMVQLTQPDQQSDSQSQNRLRGDQVEPTPFDPTDDLCTPIPTLLGEVIEKQQQYGQISQLDLTQFISTPDYFSTPQMPLNFDFFSSLSILYLFAMISPNFLEQITLLYTPNTFIPAIQAIQQTPNVTKPFQSVNTPNVPQFTQPQPLQQPHPHSTSITQSLITALPLLFNSPAAQTFRSNYNETLISTLNHIVATNFKFLNTNDGGFFAPSQFLTQTSLFPPQVISLFNTIPTELFTKMSKGWSAVSNSSPSPSTSPLTLLSTTLQPFYYQSYFARAPYGLYGQRIKRLLLTSFLTYFLSLVSSFIPSTQASLSTSATAISGEVEIETRNSPNTLKDRRIGESVQIVEVHQAIQRGNTPTNTSSLTTLKKDELSLEFANFTAFLNMNKAVTTKDTQNAPFSTTNPTSLSPSSAPLSSPTTSPTSFNFVQFFNKHCSPFLPSASSTLSPAASTDGQSQTSLQISQSLPQPPLTPQQPPIHSSPLLLFTALLLFTISSPQLQLPTPLTPHLLNLIHEHLNSTNTLTPPQLRYFQLLLPSLSVSEPPRPTSASQLHEILPTPLLHHQHFDQQQLQAYRDYTSHLVQNNRAISPFFSHLNHLAISPSIQGDLDEDCEEDKSTHSDFLINTYTATPNVEQDEYSVMRTTCPDEGFRDSQFAQTHSPQPSLIPTSPIYPLNSPQSSLSPSSPQSPSLTYNTLTPPHNFSDTDLVFAFTVRIAVDSLCTHTDRIKHTLNRHYETANSSPREYEFTPEQHGDSKKQNRGKTIQSTPSKSLPQTPSTPRKPHPSSQTDLYSTPTTRNATPASTPQSNRSQSSTPTRSLLSTPLSSRIIATKSGSNTQPHKSPLISRFPTLPTPQSPTSSPWNRQVSFNNQNNSNDNSQPHSGLSHDITTAYLNQREIYNTPASTAPPNQTTDSTSSSASSHSTTPSPQHSAPLLLTYPLHPSFLTFAQILNPYSTLRSCDSLLLLPINFTAAPMPTMQLLKRQKSLSRLSSSPLNPTSSTLSSPLAHLAVLPKTQPTTYLTRNYLELSSRYSQLARAFAKLVSNLHETSLHIACLVDELTTNPPFTPQAQDRNYESAHQSPSFPVSAVGKFSTLPPVLMTSIQNDRSYIDLDQSFKTTLQQLSQVAANFSAFYSSFIPHRLLSSPFLSAFMQPPITTSPLPQRNLATHHHRRNNSSPSFSNADIQSQPNNFASIDLIWNPMALGTSGLITATPQHINLYFRHAYLPPNSLDTPNSLLTDPQQTSRLDSIDDSDDVGFQKRANQDINCTRQKVQQLGQTQPDPMYLLEYLEPVGKHSWNELVSIHTGLQSLDVTLVFAKKSGMVCSSLDVGHPAQPSTNLSTASYLTSRTLSTLANLNPIHSSNSNPSSQHPHSHGGNPLRHSTHFNSNPNPNVDTSALFNTNDVFSSPSGIIAIKPATVNMYKVITNSKQSTLALIETITKYSQLFRTITEIRPIYTRLASPSSPQSSSDPLSGLSPPKTSVFNTLAQRELPGGADQANFTTTLQRVPLDIVLDTESSINLSDDILFSIITYTTHHSQALQLELNPHKILSHTAGSATTQHPDKFAPNPSTSMHGLHRKGSAHVGIVGSQSTQQLAQFSHPFPWQPISTRLSHISRVFVSMIFATIDFNTMNGHTRVFEPFYPFHPSPTSSSNFLPPPMLAAPRVGPSGPITTSSSTPVDQTRHQSDLFENHPPSTEYTDFLLHCHKQITAQRDQVQTIGSQKVPFPTPSTPSFSLNTTPPSQSPSVLNQTTPLSHSVLFCALVNGHLFMIEDALTSVINYNNIPFSHQQKAFEYSTSLYSHDYTRLPTDLSDPHSTLSFIIPATLFPTAHLDIHALTCDVTTPVHALIANSGTASNATKVPSYLDQCASPSPTTPSNQSSQPSTPSNAQNSNHSYNFAGMNSNGVKRYRVVACEPIASLLSIITHPVNIPISPLDLNYGLESGGNSNNFSLSLHAPHLTDLSHLQQNPSQPGPSPPAKGNLSNQFSSGSDINNITLTFGTKEVFNSVIYTARMWSVFAPSEVLTHLLKHINQQRVAR